MLQVRKLTFTHIKDIRVILKDFNMVLNKGDKAVIIGEEGNGKSTLLKWIYQPELVSDYVEYQGSISYSNEVLGYLPQELAQEDKQKTIYEFFLDCDAFLEQSPKALGSYASQFNIPVELFYSDQLMGSLSGGEKIKLQLIRILMMSPTILLLDEPSNDLDLPSLELLESIINEFDHIVLFISHDETLIENTANMIIHLEQIKRKTESRYTVVRKAYRQYVEDRNNAIDYQNKQFLNDRREKKLRDEKYQRVQQSVEHALRNVSRQAPSEAKNLKDKVHTIKAMGKRFEKEDAKMTQRVEVEEAINLSIGNEDSYIPNGKTVIEFHLEELKSLDGESSLARNIDLSIRGHEKVVIVGKNGIGKTTLLKLIYQELKDRKDLKVIYMPQNYEEDLDLSLTPVQFLNESGEREKDTKIRTHLGSLKFTPDEMNHAMADLSGGQKAKVLLLKMSLEEVNVLVLDEPTRNFSPLSGPVIRSLFKEFKGAIISISHDRKYIHEVVDTIYELKEDGLKKNTSRVL